MTTPTSNARASASILRQPVVHPDRSIFAYAVRGIVPDSSGLPQPEESVEHLVDAMFRTIDLTRLAGERPLVIRPTRSVLANPAALLELPHGVVVEVPPHLQSATGAAERLGGLVEDGVRLALGDYSGTTPSAATQSKVCPGEEQRADKRRCENLCSGGAGILHEEGDH